MSLPPRPTAISGSFGSRVKVILGSTGSDYVLILDQVSEDREWQSHHWHGDSVNGIPDGLLRQINNCSRKGRIVTQMSIDVSWNRFFIQGKKRDGTGLYNWWEGGPLVDADRQSDLQVSFGDFGRWFLLRENRNCSFSSNLDSSLKNRVNRIYRRGEKISKVSLFPSHGYFISDSEGSQWNSFSILSQEIKSGKGKVLDVVTSPDGSWIVIRPDEYVTSVGISSELKALLKKFYWDHRSRKIKRDQEIQKYDADVKKHTEAEKRRLEEEARRQEEELRARIARQAAEEAARKRKEEEERAIREAERKRKEREEQVKRKREEETRISQIQRKRIRVGDQMSAVGYSVLPGDLVVVSVGDDGVKVRSKKKTFTITDPRKLTPFHPEKKSKPQESLFVLLCQARDKFEAAISLYHCECHDGVCACTRIAHGSVSFNNAMNDLKRGESVRVKGHGNAIVDYIDISPRGEKLIQLIGNDMSTFRVRPESLEATNLFESPFRLVQVLEHRGEVEPFDEFSCAEKIDVRRLKSVLNDLAKDRSERRECLDELRSMTGEGYPAVYKLWLTKMERCQSFEMTAQTLYDFLKDQPQDKDGCVVHKVEYEHRDSSFRGRLFALGKKVDTGLDQKYPRTITLQGMQNDLRAPVVGAFGRDIDCQNSDVRLLCSLATQMELMHLIPALVEYRDNRKRSLELISSHHNVGETAAKRLASIIVSGGDYYSWMRNMKTGTEPLRPNNKIKEFAHKLHTEVGALRDQLLQHTRFRWTSIERERLKEEGKSEEEIKELLLPRIVFSCENEVLGILHRSFHFQGWKVRAKIFDGLIVEAHENKGPNSLEEAMRSAEKDCLAQGWDVRLIEKSLFGKQDDEIPSIADARVVLSDFDGDCY